MKKLALTLLLALVGTTAFAQHWTGPSANDYQDRAPLIVKFYLGSKLAQLEDNVELAAFLVDEDGNEECRGDIRIWPENTEAYDDVNLLDVYGNPGEDDGKTIEFKVFHKDLEYRLKVTDTWSIDMENHPIPLTLVVDTLAEVKLPEEINLQGTFPFTKNLMPYVTYVMQGREVEKTETANSELISSLIYTWDYGNSADFFTVDDISRLTAYKECEQAYLGLSVTPDIESATYVPESFSAYTFVNISAAVIPVTAIAVSPDVITCHLGENIWDQMDFQEVEVTFTPEDASNQSFDLKWEGQSGIDEQGTFTEYGVFTVKVVAADDENIFATLTVKVPQPISVTCPAEINVYTTHNVQLKLTNPQGEGFDGSKISIVFDEMDNFGPVATASAIDDSGLLWRVRGKVFGSSYIYYVFYDGEPIPVSVTEDEGGDNMISDCVCGLVNVHYEVEAAEGWDWISVYALPNDEPTISLINADNGEYLNVLKNNLIEMRTQKKLLYNDPEKGFFGDITALDPEEGMLKVKSKSLIRIDAGSDVMAECNYMNILPKGQGIKKGYNWISYVSCENHTLNTEWCTDPTEGDMIIGKDNFATYTGGAWVTSSQTPLVFKVGKGYIYYANGTDTRVDFNNLFEPDNGVKQFVDAQEKFQELTGLTANTESFADNMPIIATIPNLNNPEEFVIGAFVGNECRGFGSVAKDDAMFINVAGKMGEIITFRLINIYTGETIDLNETVGYSFKAGSITSPVKLTGETTAIQSIQSDFDNKAEIYDTTGRRIEEPAHGIFIMKNANGKNVKIYK